MLCNVWMSMVTYSFFQASINSELILTLSLCNEKVAVMHLEQGFLNFLRARPLFFRKTKLAPSSRMQQNPSY